MDDAPIKPTNYLEDIGLWPTKANIRRTYIIGFILSLLLTLIAYSVAVGMASTSMLAIGVLIVLACIQFAVQIICFLHLGTEHKSRARLFILLSIILIVLILVIGSLWIMYMLNLRMMPSTEQMMQYMNSQEGI